eukprot:6172478-Pleurochrysis_carterae.AAC.1
MLSKSSEEHERNDSSRAKWLPEVGSGRLPVSGTSVPGARVHLKTRFVRGNLYRGLWHPKFASLRVIIWFVRWCRRLPWAPGLPGSALSELAEEAYSSPPPSASPTSEECECDCASSAPGDSFSAWLHDSTSSSSSDPAAAALYGSASFVFSSTSPASSGTSARRVSECGVVETVASPCEPLDERTPSANDRRCIASSNLLRFHRVNSSGNGLQHPNGDYSTVLILPNLYPDDMVQIVRDGKGRAIVLRAREVFVERSSIQ